MKLNCVPAGNITFLCSNVTSENMKSILFCNPDWTENHAIGHIKTSLKILTLKFTWPFDIITNGLLLELMSQEMAYSRARDKNARGSWSIMGIPLTVMDDFLCIKSGSSWPASPFCALFNQLESSMFVTLPNKSGMLILSSCHLLLHEPCSTCTPY